MTAAADVTGSGGERERAFNTLVDAAAVCGGLLGEVAGAGVSIELLITAAAECVSSTLVAG